MTEQAGNTDGVVVALSAPEPHTGTGGCPQWPVSYAECDTLGPDACWTATARLTWETMAIDYLWQWTGRTFGVCPVPLRPCRMLCHDGRWTYGPELIGGQWFNIGCGACGDLCSCASPAALKLPGPVAAVASVTVDGVVLPQAAYRVDNGHVLVRTDGESWPTCQEMSLAPTEVGTWQVTYSRGVPVPVGGQVAAGVLAVELAKAACADPSCQLPRRVQSITRQGVTVALLDSFDDVEKGRTGVWLIDSWVASVTQPRRGGTVRSVDVPSPRHRVTTWTEPVPVIPP